MKNLIIALATILLFGCEKEESVKPVVDVQPNYLIYTCEQKEIDLLKAKEALDSTSINSELYNIARTRVAYIESRFCY